MRNWCKNKHYLVSLADLDRSFCCVEFNRSEELSSSRLKVIRECLVPTLLLQCLLFTVRLQARRLCSISSTWPPRMSTGCRWLFLTSSRDVWHQRLQSVASSRRTRLTAWMRTSLAVLRRSFSLWPLPWPRRSRTTSKQLMHATQTEALASLNTRLQFRNSGGGGSRSVAGSFGRWWTRPEGAEDSRADSLNRSAWFLPELFHNKFGRSTQRFRLFSRNLLRACTRLSSFIPSSLSSSQPVSGAASQNPDLWPCQLPDQARWPLGAAPALYQARYSPHCCSE